MKTSSASALIRFENCQILRNGRIESNDYLMVRNGKVQDQIKLYFEEQVEPDIRIDCKGALISPGLIDIQVNGGFGIDFSHNVDNVEEGLTTVSQGLLQYGVTAFCPTIVSSHPDIYKKILPEMAVTKRRSGGAINLGVHVEGPFVNKSKVGAHATQHLRTLEHGSRTLLETYGGSSNLENIKIVTLAPEIEGALETINYLSNRGIVVSIGHSTANLCTAEAAVRNGATLITHLFNAMVPFHHRDPGILGLLTSEKIPVEKRPIYFGLINDGCHTDPAAVRMVTRANYEGLVLVTDAVSAMGLADGIHYIGEMAIEIKGNCAHLLGTNTLCGSILTLNKCVKLFTEYNKCDKVKALEAATLHPAQVLGIADHKGTLNVGADADFTFFDDNFDVLCTWINGCCLYSRDENVYQVLDN